jgi:hypothetical protein
MLTVLFWAGWAVLLIVVWCREYRTPPDDDELDRRMIIHLNRHYPDDAA